LARTPRLRMAVIARATPTRATMASAATTTTAQRPRSASRAARPVAAVDLRARRLRATIPAAAPQAGGGGMSS
jgi:hypothetical protein